MGNGRVGENCLQRITCWCELNQRAGGLIVSGNEDNRLALTRRDVKAVVVDVIERVARLILQHLRLDIGIISVLRHKYFEMVNSFQLEGETDFGFGGTLNTLSSVWLK